MKNLSSSVNSTAERKCLSALKSTGVGFPVVLQPTSTQVEMLLNSAGVLP